MQTSHNPSAAVAVRDHVPINPVVDLIPAGSIITLSPDRARASLPCWLRSFTTKGA